MGHPASYLYNKDGSVQSITYPSTRALNYTYGGAGRALSVVDSVGPINYVTSATYAPHGVLSTFTNGFVSGGFTGANSYSNRLQPVLISAASPTASILSLCYDFHLKVTVSSPPCPTFNANAVGDNGDVYQIVNNRDGNRTQNFVYDPLNRIGQAYTSGSNWGEIYTIDPWGNLTNIAPKTGKGNSETLNAAPAGVNNQLTGFGYDAAGNLSSNGIIGYTYDMESHLTKFVDNTSDIYLYDGDGRRVKKSASGVTLYWYGASDNVLDETDGTGNLVSEYIFFNGKRMARRDADNTVKFYFSDNLGSAGVVTNSQGAMPPLTESDYYPYGGEIAITGGDSNHYKFTGKERDSESGLDNFGARYYASNMARFSTPDMGAFHFDDPQSLNRYIYSLNNPLRFVDPDGMNPIDAVLLDRLEHFTSWADAAARARVSALERGGPSFMTERSSDDLKRMHTFGLDDFSDVQASSGRMGAEIDLYTEQMEDLVQQIAAQVTAWANLDSTSEQEIKSVFHDIEINQRGLDQTAEEVKKTASGAGAILGKIPGPIGKWLGGTASAISFGASTLEDSYQRYLTQLAENRLEQALKNKDKKKEKTRIDKNRQLNPQ